MGKQKKVRPSRSLMQYVRDKKRAKCPVCQLPVEIRGQLREASNKKISVVTQLQWLKDEMGIVITPEHINSHRGGRHEEPAL